MRKFLLLFLPIIMVVACAGDPNADMAAPDEISLAPKAELSEKAAEALELAGDVTFTTGGGLFHVKVPLKAKKEISSGSLYVLAEIQIRQGEKVLAREEGSFAQVPGPLNAGQAFEASFNVPQSGQAGKRVIVITAITDKT